MKIITTNKFAQLSQNNSYRGRVIKETVNNGSKSEHNAVLLETANGKYMLRRVGGNAFSDPQLNELVGQNIECDGKLHDNILFINNWKQAKLAQRQSLFNTLPSTAPVQQEGLGQSNQIAAPGAVGQPAAHPAEPQNGIQNGPVVEPSDPDADMAAAEDELFPVQQGKGGNARPDVYQDAQPAMPPAPAPMAPKPMNRPRPPVIAPQPM